MPSYDSEDTMIRLDHLAILVRNVARSRDWYVNNFGFEIEMELPERKTVGLKDDGDLTLFLEETPGEWAPSCKFALQVADVEAKHRELSARGVDFEKAPQKLYGGTVRSCAIPMAIWCPSGTSVPCARRGTAESSGPTRAAAWTARRAAAKPRVVGRQATLETIEEKGRPRWP
jgi:hypothetical protein